MESLKTLSWLTFGVDAEKLLAGIDESNLRFDLKLNPVWREVVAMYFRSLAKAQDIELGGARGPARKTIFAIHTTAISWSTITEWRGFVFQQLSAGSNWKNAETWSGFGARATMSVVKCVNAISFAGSAIA